MKNKRNPIQDYLMEHSDKNTVASKELFSATDNDIKLKSDLSQEEIIHISTLLFNDRIISQAGLNPVFSPFIQDYMRLKVSLERKGRGEFVKINSGDKSEEMLSNFGNLSNIMNTKR